MSAGRSRPLDGPLFLAGKSNRCANRDCPHPGATFYASAVLALSLPYATYGLDVVACIGWRHEHDHRQLVEIQRDLVQRGLLINERTVGKLYRQFLALLGGTTPHYQQRLQAAAQLPGGLIYAIDALQPEGGDPPLYVLYEVLSHTPVSALQESNPTTERLRAWREPVTLLSFPVLATLSDGENALVAALKASWSHSPPQRCQLHFLNNIAKGALEVDGRLRQHLRQELGDLAAVPQASQDAPHSPADAAQLPPWRP